LSASRSGRFIPAERAPAFPLGRRLVGPQSRCGRHGEDTILDANRTRNLIPPTALSLLVSFISGVGIKSVSPEKRFFLHRIYELFMNVKYLLLLH
jgi:hypothetical protein